MPVTSASAPGKIIIFGEHAVVYSQPAIAAPLSQVRATAVVEDGTTTGVRLSAPDLGRDYWLRQAADDDPFAHAVREVIKVSGLQSSPDLMITVRSALPIASGLGSGAAMAAAVIRALTKHLGLLDLATDQQVSRLTYQVEKLLHGTPSGIDNTVVAYERPVYFLRRRPENQIETLSVAKPLHLLVADTGVVSMTRDVVGDVRRQWKEDPERFESLFDACGRVARAAREAIEKGDEFRLGALMNENQDYLREMTVSSPELESLVTAAVDAGALGAKLSGAGRGGNMIALVTEKSEEKVRRTLLDAGARLLLRSIVQ